MFRKLLGYALYFLGLGLWFILLSALLFWSIPWIVLAFFAGWLTHSREWREFKEFTLWKWLRDFYFKFELIGKLPDTPDDGRIIYAIYPHGHFSMTATFYWALNPLFSNARAAVHSFIFYVPLFASFVRWIGAIPVTEREMKAALKAGRPIYMCPGGVAEIAKTGHDIVKRSGFIRIACETGATLYPVWCPDERSYYSHWMPLGRALEHVFGFPIPLFIWGKWWCPVLPNNSISGSRIYVGTPVTTEGKTRAEVETEFWNEMAELQRKL
jgi:hypothetical protein